MAPAPEVIGKELLDVMHDCVAVYELDGTVIYTNEPNLTTFGLKRQEYVGRNLWQLFPAAVGNEFHEAFEQVAKTGRPVQFEFYFAPWRRWFLNHMYRIGSHVYVVARETTAEKNRERGAVALSEASRLFGEASGDLKRTLQLTARYLAESMGDMAAIFLASEVGAKIELRAIQHRDPEGAEYAASWIAAAPADFESTMSGRVVRTGKAVLIPKVDVDEQGHRFGPASAEAVRKLRASSLMAAPMRAFGVTLGAIVMLRHEDAEAFHEGDLRLLQDLADRAGLAVSNARNLARAEEAARRLTLVTDALPALVLLVDKEERYVFANAASRDWYGCAPDNLLGKRVRDVFDKSAYDHLAPSIKRALSGDYVSFESTMRYPAGGERRVRAHYVPQRDANGEPAGYAALVLDVTAEWRALASLREQTERVHRSEARFRSLVLATAQIVWTANAAGAIEEDSPSWRAFTGQTREQWQGQGRLEAVHPADRPKVSAAWSRALAQKEMLELEYRIRRPDGSYTWTLGRVVPILNDDGSVREWIGTNTDISQRVAAEEQAREAARRKDEFLAMLGHELRNPLAPILTALELMKMRGEGGEKERAVIERQVGHVVRLVDDLLDVSRITKGKVTLKRQEVELAKIVAMAVEIASPLFEQRRSRLEISVPRTGLMVFADPERLAQVFSNLLTNAAKYSEPGGRVAIVAKNVDGAAKVDVIDEGIGIDAGLLPRLFEPFVQSPQAADRAQGGLGLGLALVRSLVELHGGTVSAQSGGLKQGSVFCVHLPLAEPRAESSAPESRRVVPRKPGVLRVLVVDDNEDAADLIAESLRMNGHRVAVAHDAPGALAAAEQFVPELALLDIGLPVMDGYELGRRLRERFSAIRLVAVTGYGQDSDRMRAREAGFEAHLVKPVDLDVLTATLHEMA